VASPTTLGDVGGGAASGASFGSMFGPIGTLVGLGLGAAAGGVKAYGDYSAGQSGAKAYQYQASIARMNAAIANQNAVYATKVGEAKAQISGMQTRAQIGETKAIQGASGLDVNKGSAVDVRASEADIGEQNEMTIRSNAAKQAYDFRVGAVGDIAQANIDTAAAKTTKTAGTIGAASSILGSASSVSSKWAQFSQQGTMDDLQDTVQDASED
jgi:hypothetical protein